MAAWFNALCRWVGVVEHSAATSEQASVLCALQASVRPMTLPHIQAETMIVREDLARLLDTLETDRKITVTRGYDGNVKLYAPNDRVEKE